MKGSFQGLLQAKVGQASVGTAVARCSHYCSSAASEKKEKKVRVEEVVEGGRAGVGERREVATAPTTWPLCHGCTPVPLPHTYTGTLARPGRTGSARRHHSLAAPVTCGRAKQRVGSWAPGWQPGVRARMGG